MTNDEKIIKKLNFIFKTSDIFKLIEDELLFAFKENIKSCVINEKVEIHVDNIDFYFRLDGKYDIFNRINIFSTPIKLPSHLMELVFKIYLKHEGETPKYKIYYSKFLKEYRKEKITSLL
jgi:hypothetical protein